jgi:glyoxylase-like metal-dependent hydrolase (beta-lactamase superfamily II)
VTNHLWQEDLAALVALAEHGTGAQLMPTAGLIAKNDLWKAAGIDPGEVTNIVVSHFHPDHITGLMAKDTNAPIFPKAQIHVPAAEYKFWTNPATTAGAAKRIQAVFPGWSNIRQFEGDVEVVPGVRAINTNGHTPGHMSYHIGSGNQQLIVLGDVTNIPSLFVKNPGWHAVFDTDGPLAEANRRTIFDRIVADKVTITGYHTGASAWPDTGRAEPPERMRVIRLLQARAVDDPQAAANAMTLKEDDWFSPSVPWGTAFDQVYL